MWQESETVVTSNLWLHLLQRASPKMVHQWACLWHYPKYVKISRQVNLGMPVYYVLEKTQRNSTNNPKLPWPQALQLIRNSTTCSKIWKCLCEALGLHTPLWELYWFGDLDQLTAWDTLHLKDLRQWEKKRGRKEAVYSWWTFGTFSANNVDDSRSHVVQNHLELTM